jgi:hypothetical protein
MTLPQWTQTRGAERRSPSSSSGSWALELCLGKERAGTCKVSGSPLWKEAQQEVLQHWFIDSYIAAYIQMQYRVGGVHPTGQTVARGVRRCPQYFVIGRIKK